MTNQPIREARLQAMLAFGQAMVDEGICISSLNESGTRDELCEKTARALESALSILSTALAERDAKIAELEEQAWQLKADAYRYRWLRERDLDTIHKGGVFAGSTPRNVVINGEDLDWAVDEARGIEAEARAKLKESSRG